jgi:hypothetical protein
VLVIVVVVAVAAVVWFCVLKKRNEPSELYTTPLVDREGSNRK